MGKKDFKLYLDSADRKKIIVRLYENTRLLAKNSKIQQLSSQVLLTLIDNICRENKITPSDLTQIELNTGPGSYTGLKVGATVANALGWLLNIPVNGTKDGIVEPVYQ